MTVPLDPNNLGPAAFQWESSHVYQEHMCMDFSVLDSKSVPQGADGHKALEK